MLKNLAKFSVLLSIAVTILTSAFAQDDQKTFQAYNGEPPQVVLSAEELNLLASGQAVFKKLQLDDAQRGVAIFRVNADAGTIWSVIKDFGSYPQWIESLDQTEIYNHDDENIYVKFTAGSWLAGNTTWYAIHNYPQGERDWGTWRLDRDESSDLDDSVGFWRVLPVTDKPQQSDVIYSADIRLKGFFASLFEVSLVDSSLKEATQWVKVQAEALANDQSQDQVNVRASQ